MKITVYIIDTKNPDMLNPHQFMNVHSVAHLDDHYYIRFLDDKAPKKVHQNLVGMINLK